MSSKRYTIEAGRGLCRDGVRIATIAREVDACHKSPTTPVESDELCHVIAARLNGEPGATITIDLDALDLETAPAGGIRLARVDIMRGGRRISAVLSLYQHELRRDPTLRLTVIKPGNDVVREVAVRPWVREEGE